MSAITIFFRTTAFAATLLVADVSFAAARGPEEGTAPSLKPIDLTTSAEAAQRTLHRVEQRPQPDAETPMELTTGDGQQASEPNNLACMDSVRGCLP